MPPKSIAADKNRILTQLQINLLNFPDEPDVIAALVPQLKAQASSIVKIISADDFTPAELMALMSLIGPVLARTPLRVPSKGPKRTPLRAV